MDGPIHVILALILPLAWGLGSEQIFESIRRLREASKEARESVETPAETNRP